MIIFVVALIITRMTSLLNEVSLWCKDSSLTNVWVFVFLCIQFEAIDFQGQWEDSKLCICPFTFCISMFCFVLGFVPYCVLFEMVDPWSQWEEILLMSNHFHKENVWWVSQCFLGKFSPFCENILNFFLIKSLFLEK